MTEPRPVPADDAGDVPVRGRTAGDNATPSGNGLMAEVQARLFHLTGDDRWRRAAEATIGAFAGNSMASAARRLAGQPSGGPRGEAAASSLPSNSPTAPP